MGRGLDIAALDQWFSNFFLYFPMQTQAPQTPSTKIIKKDIAKISHYPL